MCPYKKWENGKIGPFKPYLDFIVESYRVKESVEVSQYPTSIGIYMAKLDYIRQKWSI